MLNRLKQLNIMEQAIIFMIYLVKDEAPVKDEAYTLEGEVAPAAE